MSQLESLTAFITANLPPDAMQMFSSSMEDCELVRNAKALGNNQRRIGVLTYTARLSWDDFPYRKYSPGLVMPRCWHRWMNSPTNCATS